MCALAMTLLSSLLAIVAAVAAVSLGCGFTVTLLVYWATGVASMIALIARFALLQSDTETAQ